MPKYYYELTFLTPNLEEKERKKLMEKIKKKIKDLGGKIREEFIEKKFFAYPVKKHESGFFGVIDFDISPDKIIEIKQFLALEENILRDMIEKRRIFEEEKAPKVTEKPKKKKKVKIEKLEEKLEEILE